MKKKLNSPDSLLPEDMTYEQFHEVIRSELKKLHVTELPVSVGTCQKETILVAYINIELDKAFLAGMECLSKMIVSDESSDSPDDDVVDEDDDLT